MAAFSVLLVALPLALAVLLHAVLLQVLELWQVCAPRRLRELSAAKSYFLRRLRLLRAGRSRGASRR